MSKIHNSEINLPRDFPYIRYCDWIKIRVSYICVTGTFLASSVFIQRTVETITVPKTSFIAHGMTSNCKAGIFGVSKSDLSCGYVNVS